MAETMGERIFEEIRTLEQGKNYILTIVGQLEQGRNQCDSLHKRSAVGEPVPRETINKSYRNVSVRYGQALGALTTLMHCRVLTDEAYNELHQRIHLAMAPKVLGVVQG
jgi:hypothetical protein